MGEAAERIYSEALDLSEDERAAVAEKLLRSLGGDLEADVDEAWLQEARRRLEELHQGDAEARSAESVFQDVRSEFE